MTHELRRRLQRQTRSVASQSRGPSALSRVWKGLTICVLASLVLVTARLDAFAHIPHDVVTRVALSPAFPHDGIVFAIVRDVLFRSEDGGYEWQRLSSDLYGCWPTALAISPVFSIDQTLFVSCRQGQVYRSQDLGKSWAPYEQMLAREDIVFLVPSPGFAADRTLLALGSEGHLYRTTDGGGWSHILGDSSAITALDWAADLLVAGTASGTIHLSKDGGTTWRKVGQHPRGQRITCIEVPVRTSSAEPFFVGTDGEGVCRVCEGDGSFECANSSTANQPITDMASLFEHDRLTLFASAWDEALSRSSDGGATWTQYGSDLPRSSQADQYGEAHFKTLAVADDGTVFLGSFCGLWRSDDLGLSWVPLETTLHHIIGLDVAPAAGGGHTVGITTYGGGAYSTSNDRRSWQIHNFGVTNPRLGAMVYSPNYAQDETVFVAHYNAVLSSTDGGVHWRRPSVRPPGWIVRGLKGVILRVVSRFRALRHTSLSTYLRQTSRSYAFPSAVAVSPAFPDDHTVFAGLFPYGVVRSEDGGSTFAWMWDTQGSRVWSLVISPDFATDRTLFTSLTDGIYRSVDGGDHWVQMGQDAGLQDAVLAISPQYARDRTLFAGNATGLFRTQDAGKTWLRLHVEPHRGEEPIAGVAISPNFATSRQLLVQIRGGNLFVCRDLEDRFEATPTTAAGAGYEFSQLIFGKETAPLIAFSPDYVDDQTVYAASVQHLVRTADGGRTWEEIPRPVRYEAEASLMREFFFPTSLEGRWRSDTGKLYSNTQCIYSTRAHSKVTLHFVGSGVRWVGARGPDRGVASVFIDGTLRGKVDEFSAERAFSVELFSAEGLAPGPHTITIEVDGVRNARSSGTRVDIDALDVIRRG